MAFIIPSTFQFVMRKKFWLLPLALHHHDDITNTIQISIYKMDLGDKTRAEIRALTRVGPKQRLGHWLG